MNEIDRVRICDAVVRRGPLSIPGSRIRDIVQHIRNGYSLQSSNRGTGRLSYLSTIALLRDLGSKNGTFRGETRVGESVDLSDGDEIRIGTVRIRFRAAVRDSTVTASS
jgi:hypothetical protein